MPPADHNIVYYVDVVKHRWRLAALIVCAIVAGAVVYVFTSTPQYRASVQLFAATQPSLDQSTQGLFDGTEFTQARVLSYQGLVTSSEVTTPVIKQLGLHVSNEELARQISVKVPLGTVLLNISVTNPTPRAAQRIANAVAGTMITLIGRLETSGGSPSPVKVSVSDPAALPSTPVSPHKKLTLAIALIMGMFLSVIAVLARERLDTVIRDVEDLSQVTDIPTLAEIPLVPGSLGDRRPTAKTRVAIERRLETLRQLRVSLQFLDVDHPIDALIVTSSLPGEGKSTLAWALAEVTAEAGRIVTLIDGDLRRPSISSRMSFEGTVPGLTDALVADDNVLDLLVRHQSLPNLRILTGGTSVPNPSEVLSSGRLRDVLATVRDDCDLLIIDTPPLLAVSDGALLAGLTGGALVVAEMGRTRYRELETSLNTLAGVGARVLGIVANKAAQRDASYYSSYYAAPHADIVGEDLAPSQQT